MATQCMAWRVKDENMPRFINEKQYKFHIPYRCEGRAIQGDKVCDKCADNRNKPKPTKVMKHDALWWGTIDKPIADCGASYSRAIGSIWFEKKFKEGHRISVEDMSKAKIALKGTAMEGLTEALTETAAKAPASAPAKEKKKPGPKAKKEEGAPLPEPKKIKVKVKVKKAEVTQPVAVVQEEPIEPEEVHVVQVIKKELNGKQYYYDLGKKKVYEPSTGKYVGRWDSVKELVITSIPDSDAE